MTETRPDNVLLAAIIQNSLSIIAPAVPRWNQGHGHSEPGAGETDVVTRSAWPLIERCLNAWLAPHRWESADSSAACDDGEARLGRDRLGPAGWWSSDRRFRAGTR